MDIEDLSKTQLLLLTILVNFVIAIATAVMTVSLLDQAPTAVTQTVNRIVENTIETVTTQVPVINDSSAPSTEELLTASIASNISRTVDIRRSAGGEVIGRGFFIVTSRAILTIPSTIPLPDEISVTFSEGTVATATRIRDDGRIVMYQIADGVTLPKVRSAELVASESLKPGQTLIGIASDGSVATGLLTKIDANGIQSDVPVLPAGSVLFTLSGDIAGMSAGTAAIIPAEFIGTLLAPPAP